jgi:cytochrome b561
MLSSIALIPILGYPAIMYGGITAFVLLFITAIVGKLVLKGKAKLKLHMILAWLVIIIALIHGIMGLSILLGF